MAMHTLQNFLQTGPGNDYAKSEIELVFVEDNTEKRITDFFNIIRK